VDGGHDKPAITEVLPSVEWLSGLLKKLERKFVLSDLLPPTLAAAERTTKDALVSMAQQVRDFVDELESHFPKIRTQVGTLIELPEARGAAPMPVLAPLSLAWVDELQRIHQTTLKRLRDAAGHHADGNAMLEQKIESLEKQLKEAHSENQLLQERIQTLKGQYKVGAAFATSGIKVPWRSSWGLEAVEGSATTHEVHSDVAASGTQCELVKESALASDKDQLAGQQQIRAATSIDELSKAERRMQKAERRRREIEVQQRANLCASLKAFETVALSTQLSGYGGFSVQQEFRRLLDTPTSSPVNVNAANVELPAMVCPREQALGSIKQSKARSLRSGNRQHSFSAAWSQLSVQELQGSATRQQTSGLGQPPRDGKLIKPVTTEGFQGSRTYTDGSPLCDTEGHAIAMEQDDAFRSSAEQAVQSDLGDSFVGIGLTRGNLESGRAWAPASGWSSHKLGRSRASRRISTPAEWKWFARSPQALPGAQTVVRTNMNKTKL